MTYDADQDESTGFAPERTRPTWNGFGLIDEIDRVLVGQGIRYTAFVRMDQQIRELYGQAHSLYLTHRASFERIQARGNELAWHPHLYERVQAPTGRERYRPVRDEDVACILLETTFAELKDAGLGFDSVRLGEAWQSSRTMRKLDELGLHVDSTAIPGRARSDDLFVFDWIPTPSQPYHPSREDYRVPGSVTSGDALSILEVPMTTVPIRMSYDREPLRRYLNLAFHPDLFRSGLRAFLEERPMPVQGEIDRQPWTLTLVFHTGEVLPGEPTELCPHSFDAFQANVQTLTGSLNAEGLDLEYFAMREAVRR